MQLVAFTIRKGYGIMVIPIGQAESTSKCEQRVGRGAAGAAGAAVGRKPLQVQPAVVAGTNAANIADSSDWSGKKHVVLGGERIDGRKNL